MQSREVWISPARMSSRTPRTWAILYLINYRFISHALGKWGSLAYETRIIHNQMSSFCRETRRDTSWLLQPPRPLCTSPKLGYDSQFDFFDFFVDCHETRSYLDWRVLDPSRHCISSSSDSDETRPKPRVLKLGNPQRMAWNTCGSVPSCSARSWWPAPSWSSSFWRETS